jgi:O-antigen ligase
MNWTQFTSTDREAGGVASPREVQDRLNIDQTALWAAEQRPLTGWGIGRFASVNTYHHQQWSPEIPFIRGWGAVPHENELGILAELGLIGLAPWLCVLVLIAYRLWKAYRTLPDDDLCGQPLAVIAIMALAIYLCASISGDLRSFNFMPGAIFFLAGIVIGWSERHKRLQVAAGDVIAEQMRGRHA